MANAFTIKSIFEAVDRLTGPVKTMRGNMTKFSKGVKGEFSGIAQGAGKLKGLLVGAVAAITTGAAAKAMSDFASRGDDIGRNASILGLTARAYQELSFAAKMADVDQEAFASASKKLNNNLGQLQTGTGALYTILKATNPQLARQLKNAKSTDDAFSMVASAIEKETNVQKRAALAQAAFGKTGQELIPMMEGLAAARAKANAEGAVMSDEEVKNAQDMDNALKRIRISGMGIVNSFLAKMAAKLAPIVEQTATWINANKELIGQKIDKIFNTIGKAAQFIGKAWKSGLIPAILAGIAVFKTFKIVMAAATAVQWAINAAMTANPIGLIIVGVAALIAGIVLLIVHWKKVTAALKEFSGVATGYLSLFMPQIAQLIQFVIRLRENWDGIKAAFSEGGIIEGLKAIGATILQSLLRPIRDFLRLLSKIPGVGKLIAPAMNFVNGLDTQLGAAANKYKTPVSPQAAAIESRSMTENRSTVDLNVSAAPGASIAARQSGSAPGFSLNLGRPAPLGAR